MFLIIIFFIFFCKKVILFSISTFFNIFSKEYNLLHFLCNKSDLLILFDLLLILELLCLLDESFKKLIVFLLTFFGVLYFNSNNSFLFEIIISDLLLYLHFSSFSFLIIVSVICSLFLLILLLKYDIFFFC